MFYNNDPSALAVNGISVLFQGESMTETMLIVFSVTSIVLIITPGQDMVLVMSRSISQGWKAGVTTAAGVSVGLLLHTFVAAFGLGAVLQSSEILFSAMKIIGAAYLAYLGIRLLLSRDHGLMLSGQPDISLQKMFFQGALSNISNPKIVIFYLAYLPQFIPLNAHHPTLLLLVLGTLFAILTFLVKGPIGCVAGLLSRWLRSHPAAIKLINQASGFILIGLGLRLLLEKKS